MRLCTRVCVMGGLTADMQPAENKFGDVMQMKVGDTEEGRHAKRKAVSSVLLLLGDQGIGKHTLQTVYDHWSKISIYYCLLYSYELKCLSC